MPELRWSLLDEEGGAWLLPADDPAEDELVIVDVRASARFVELVEQIAARRADLRALGHGGTSGPMLLTPIPPA